MIIWIIVILSLTLLALLMDWSAIARRFPALKAWMARLRAARPVAHRAAPLQPRSKPATVNRPAVEESESTFIEKTVEVPQNEALTERSYAEDVQELLNEADIFFRKGEYKAAEQYYLKAAAKDPRCSKAYSRLGVIYLENGEDWQDAEDAFRQALKTDKDNGYILNNLGLVLYHQDKYADAIRHFELAVRQDELNANRHANLGKAYMAMRQYAKAESSFKKALKLEQNEMEYKDLLAEAIEKKQAHKAMIRR